MATMINKVSCLVCEDLISE